MALGGKGVGRFSWLKAFDRVEINSTYQDEKKWWNRSLHFSLSESGISNFSLTHLPSGKHRTEVRLVNFIDSFRAACPKRFESISNRVMEHCLPYLILGSCPKIEVVDGDVRQDLNSEFEDRVKPSLLSDKVKVGKHSLKLLHCRRYGPENSSHRLHYCANSQEVLQEKLTPYLPALGTKKLTGTDGEAFHWSTFIEGSILNDRVDTSRTTFHIPETGGDMFDEHEPVTFSEVRKAVVASVRKHLEPYLGPIQKQKLENIRSYVYNKAPRYRALLRHEPARLEEIPPDLSETDLEMKLHSILLQVESEIRADAQKLLNIDLADIKNFEQYKADYAKFVDEANDVAKASLAEHVVYRKLILDLLDKNIKAKPDGKYAFEDAVHRLIFPLKATSDEITYEHQNLWVLDERLTYHEYLASDLELKSAEPLDSLSKDRPDIIVFNGPIAIQEAGAGTRITSIVIIEFKRPERDDYSDQENPIDQVLNYVRAIREGHARDRNGKAFSLPADVPFYAYIVCDLTPRLRNVAEQRDLTAMPDGNGYFMYHSKRKTYIEVVSYAKVVDDAKRRNRVLFEKLGIAIKL